MSEGKVVSVVEQAKAALEADAQARARLFAEALQAASQQFGWTVEAQVTITPRGVTPQVTLVPVAGWVMP